MYSRETHQAPLYYFIAGRLVRLRAGWQGIAAFSVFLGCLRLILFEVGLLLVIRKSTVTRCAALGLAAVIPASVHLDGMINCDVLVGFASALTMLFALLMFRAAGQKRRLAGLALGFTSAIALLSKISALAIVAAIGATALLELVWSRETSWKLRMRQFASPLLALAVLLVSTTWYFAHNVQRYGKPIVSSYDGRDRGGMAPYWGIPVGSRRNLDFLYGWTLDIYHAPRWPSGYQPRPYLLPVLVASTFADYYQYHFAPAPSVPQPAHPEPTSVALKLSRISIVAGTILAILAIIAWVITSVSSLKARRSAEVAMLLCPLFGLLGQIWYTWVYPVDWEGPIKGVLMQFSALPLCACVGIAISWLLNRGWYARVVGVIGIASICAVASYTVYCRLWSAPLSIQLLAARH